MFSDGELFRDFKGPETDRAHYCLFLWLLDSGSSRMALMIIIFMNVLSSSTVLLRAVLWHMHLEGTQTTVCNIIFCPTEPKSLCRMDLTVSLESEALAVSSETMLWKLSCKSEGSTHYLLIVMIIRTSLLFSAVRGNLQQRL